MTERGRKGKGDPGAGKGDPGAGVDPRYLQIVPRQGSRCRARVASPYRDAAPPRWDHDRRVDAVQVFEAVLWRGGGDAGWGGWRPGLVPKTDLAAAAPLTARGHPGLADTPHPRENYQVDCLRPFNVGETRSGRPGPRWSAAARNLRPRG